MKYQIRKSVWESNSSSMHSLVVTKKNSNIRMTQEEIREEFYLDEDWYKERHKNNEKEIVKIDPWDNEFGRSPFNVLVTFEDKLAYAIAEYCGNNYSIESYIKGEKTFDEMFKPLLIRLIGCDDIEWDRWDDRPFEIYAGGGDNLDEVEQVPYDKLIYVDKDDLKDEYLNLNNSKFTDEEMSDAITKSKANNNSLEGTLSFTSKAEHDSATQTITKPETDDDDQRFGFFESIPLPYGVYAVEESVTDALNITDGFGLVDSTIAAPTFDVAINAKTIKDYGAYETEYTINADGSMFGNIPLIVVGDQPESKGIRITKKDAFTGKSVLKPNTTYKIYKVEGNYEQGQEIKQLNLVTYTTKEDGEPIRHDTWITGENGTCEAFGVEDYENFGSGTYLIVELQDKNFLVSTVLKLLR